MQKKHRLSSQEVLGSSLSFLLASNVALGELQNFPEPQIPIYKMGIFVVLPADLRIL